jgi:hypothetical protein
MPTTARQYAEYLVGRMETTGRQIVVYIKNGEVMSATDGTAKFGRVEVEGLLIVGYYDPDCLARHLADDLKEFLPA